MHSGSRKIVALVLVFALLGAALKVASSLNRMRENLELVRMDLPEQARPDLLTNVLLSVGRALAVDYLWIGLQKMQEEGRYFDAKQRADWISRLQPHFPAVWIFQAWNMSYNISVAMNTGEDRWRWVKNGYELLRDQGIPLNPRSIKMYQQLAWIFHHKIGGLSDDWHWYYKVQLARGIEPIIGWPEEKYDLMAKAPRTWKKVLEIPQMEEFIAALEAMKFNPREDFLKILKERSTQGEKVQALLDDPQYATCRRMLEGFLRSEWLLRDWKLEIDIIAELRKDGMYGPLDFRNPQAHAIYWSYKGFKVVGEDTSFDALSADRVIYGSLQDIVRQGRLFISDENLPLASPDVRFIPVVHRTYLSLGKKYAEAEGQKWDGTAGETFKSGHVNFLRKAIALYYQYGRDDMAQKYWKIMTTMYPLPDYNVGFQQYMHNYILEDLKNIPLPDASASVFLFLMESYRRYAAGDDYTAVAMERTARTVYDAYMKDRQFRTLTPRVSMPPWQEMVDRAQQQALKMLPPEMKKRLQDRLGIKPAEEGTEQGAAAK